MVVGLAMPVCTNWAVILVHALQKTLQVDMKRPGPLNCRALLAQRRSYLGNGGSIILCVRGVAAKSLLVPVTGGTRRHFCHGKATYLCPLRKMRDARKLCIWHSLRDSSLNSNGKTTRYPSCPFCFNRSLIRARQLSCDVSITEISGISVER